MTQDLTNTDKVAEAVHDGYQLTEKDIKQLETPDESFKLMTWEDLSKIIGSFCFSTPQVSLTWLGRAC